MRGVVQLENQNNQLTLYQMRTKCHMSIEDASKLSGVSEITIKRYEQDCRKAQLQKISLLLKAYSISANYLYVGVTPNGLINQI